MQANPDHSLLLHYQISDVEYLNSNWWVFSPNLFCLVLKTSFGNKQAIEISNDAQCEKNTKKIMAAL